MMILAVLIGGVVWLSFVAMLLYMGYDMWTVSQPDLGDRITGAMLVAFGLLVFVGPVAAYQSSVDDPYANTLCVRGHQEWQTTSTPVLVGKVIVPTTSTHKVWMCEQWEAR
jgi:hypothetical protein